MTNILTLRLDDASQQFFEAMRRKHFPPERNLIPAHLTLFHSLPESGEIDHALSTSTARLSPFSIVVDGLRSLGNGVAYKVSSPALIDLHRQLAEAFEPHLIAQDRQGFQPHIVIQNKATPEAARALLAELERSFHALSAEAVGLDLWHYLGGPWQLARAFPFTRSG